MRRYGRGIKKVPGEMNKTEARYALHLEGLRKEGVVDQYFYEHIKFKLADNTWYSPDFFVLYSDCSVELIDVKGTTKNKATGKQVAWIEDHSKIKIKVVADKYPFKMKTVWETKEGWQAQEF